MQIITLTTDFGIKDPYIAMMKGVLTSKVPSVSIIDITHDLSCGNTLEASFILSHTYQYFPEGTIHLVIVDPTVGGKRRRIISRHKNHYFIGPDNGVLTPFLTEVYEIKINKEEMNLGTFEGRDIFALIAAKLAMGEKIGNLGSRINNPVKINLPEPRVENGSLIGEVIYIDKFGNLISNINKDLLPSVNIEIQFKDFTINGISDNYSAGKDDLKALINGGFGLLEIALFKKSAASFTGCKIGDRLKIRRKDE